MQRIDYVNVVDGASNGLELPFFSEEASNVTRADGSVILERGDTRTVITDNSGFHHGHFTESVLKPWPNGVASRSKLKTWVHLRLRLARPCAYLR